MKKIININLAGRVIPIEDAAYDKLQRYIESLRRYFAKEEGRDEIINDIESRVAELMNDKIKKGATCVTEADIEEIIGTMGRIEDFEAADGETEPSASTTSTNQSNSKRSRIRFSGRLYRDANDKFLGGVCSGIAAYMNVDPTVVRLLFAIITFGGFGLGFLIYILLWIVLPSTSVASYSGKRFFRNPDDRILGGVAGGLAAYFNKNAWTIRAIFAAPILLKIIVAIFHVLFSPFNSDLGFNLATGSLTGTFILAYIVLWIVLPEAKTPYDKMEMRGEKVDVNRIKQNVQEGMGDFKERMQTWGEEVKTAGQRMSARAQEFTRGQGADFAADVKRTARPVGSSIGHAIGVVFKAFFLFIAGVIAFFLFVLVLVFTFGGISQPVNAFLIEGAPQKLWMWGTLIFFLAVPLIAIIVWIIRRGMNVRSQNRYLGWVFGGLWTLGWIAMILFVSSLVRDFSNTDQTEMDVTLTRPDMRKMVVQVPGTPVRYSGSFSWLNMDDDQGWDMTEDSLKLSNIRITTKQSEDSFYHVTLSRFSNGYTRANALHRAEKIEYKVTSLDSVLQLQSGFGLSKADKFRNQRVMVEIRIPVGKQIRFDHSVSDKLNPFNVRVSENERTGRRRYWGRRNYDFEWDNNWYNDWEPDTDYFMGADGKLKKAGEETIEVPSKQKDKRVKDSLLREYQRKLDSVETIQTQINKDIHPDEEETTKAKSIGGELPLPMPMPFVPTIF
jgi:phage shock protein PspC (stress-responsive transcriptional regulator)